MILVDETTQSLLLLQYRETTGGQWRSLGVVASRDEALEIAARDSLEWRLLPCMPTKRAERVDRVRGGNIYGKLTARAEVQKNGRTLWVCDCACGEEAFVRMADLRSGRVSSCGCGRRRSICPRCQKRQKVPGKGYCAECRTAYDRKAAKRRKK